MLFARINIIFVCSFGHQISKRIGRKTREVGHDHRPRLQTTMAVTPGCDSVPGPLGVRRSPLRSAALGFRVGQSRGPAPPPETLGTLGDRAAPPARAPGYAGRTPQRSQPTGSLDEQPQNLSSERFTSPQTLSTQDSLSRLPRLQQFECAPCFPIGR